MPSFIQVGILLCVKSTVCYMVQEISCDRVCLIELLSGISQNTVSAFCRNCREIMGKETLSFHYHIPVLSHECYRVFPLYWKNIIYYSAFPRYCVNGTN